MRYGFFTLNISQLAGDSGFVYPADLQQGMLEIEYFNIIFSLRNK
jgi:hypothetical protein